MSESAVVFTDNMLLDNVSSDGSNGPNREDALRSEFVNSASFLCLLHFFVKRIAPFSQVPKIAISVNNRRE